MGRIQVVIRRGAIILGISAVAAAAAAPHSPVWRFILQRPATPRRSTASPARDASTTAPLAESAASTPQGVAINPTGRVELDFRNTPAAGVLRIRTTRGVGVAVTASVDGPTYLVGRGTIVIDSRGTPGVTYDVELPPPARVSDVVIQIGARVVFARHGADVRTQAQLESDGSYRVAMAPADSLSAP